MNLVREEEDSPQARQLTTEVPLDSNRAEMDRHGGDGLDSARDRLLSP